MSFRQDIHPYELLSPYLDGELEEETRAAMEAHLAGCSSCRVLLEDFRSMAASAVMEAPPPVPADLRRRIRRALDAKQVSDGAVRGGWIRSYRLGLAAAAGIVLVIGLWALRQEPSAPLRTPAPAPPPLTPARPEEAIGLLNRLSDTGGEETRKSEPPMPAPSAQPGHEETALTARPRKWAAPPLVAPKPGSGGSRSDTLTGEPENARLQAAGTAAGASLSESGAPPGRKLLVEFPTYRVAVFEDGTIDLSAEGYSCAARPDEPSVAPDLAALFALASTSGEGVPATPGPAPPGAPVVRLVEPPATAGRAAGPTTGGMVPAAKAIEIEMRLRALLRDRYLALMEERCGPVPRAVRTP